MSNIVNYIIYPRDRSFWTDASYTFKYVAKLVHKSNGRRSQRDAPSVQQPIAVATDSTVVASTTADPRFILKHEYTTNHKQQSATIVEKMKSAPTGAVAQARPVVRYRIGHTTANTHPGG